MDSIIQSFLVFFAKFRLFLEKLPKHPDYKSATPAEKAANKKVNVC